MDLHPEVDELIDAVEQRLVLLVEREEGRFSYELRSFQEFMAAWALTTGTDEHVDARFKRIVSFAIWRNVLLLAMGRLFFERSPQRERLSLGLCDWLHNNDADPFAENSAKMLAFDILMDGLAAHSPRIQLNLESRFSILDGPGSPTELNRPIDPSESSKARGPKPQKNRSFNEIGPYGRKKHAADRLLFW